MVVLLHGFAEDAGIWKNQVSFLKQQYRLVLPDLPGSGQSEYIENGSLEVYADIVYQIILAEQKKATTGNPSNRCTIIGHSMGGYITLALVEKHPTLVNGFGLFHSSAYADTPEKMVTRKKAIEFIEKHGVTPFLQTTIPGLFYKPEQNGWADILVEQGKSFTAKALVQYYEAMILRPERTQVLKASTIPVLFVIGEHDRAVPLNMSLQQCYLPLQSHIHILNQTAHMGMLEEVTKSNTILLQFLNNCQERK